ncbi:hypothetical protein FRX31_010193 [Thalictrum thalictroides]|uniref:Uncharacterized protein n=1 Tax=Thalictrum thalictroides TaxID=46969 RepID=A0A7J6WUB0_THATH|nr:hypothetical protein FRX31_010193 [Thalictrum thalictroides]
MRWKGHTSKVNTPRTATGLVTVEDSYCMDAHEGYDFREFKQLVDYKECDFSLYNEVDPPMSCNHGDDKNDKDKGGIGSPPDN